MIENHSSPSFGLVKKQYYTFAKAQAELRLESGRLFGPITVAYETYGQLSQAKDNAILVLHALSGDSHAAGKYSETDRKPGWWDIMIGPGKPLDTDKYFIVCSNVLGGCQGTTGPSSVNPKTNKPYCLDFPVITIADMVAVQRELIVYLGIERLLAVIGGSMGGMQALEWVLAYPEAVAAGIIIASCAALSAQAIAFNAVGRNAITSDKLWNNGNYYGRAEKILGLAVARMLGHITYLSEEGMRERFGRKRKNSQQYAYHFDDEFEIESYLSHQGLSFLDRFDANSYLYITKAMDYFDLAARYGGGNLAEAFSRLKAQLLFVAFTSDWLFPPAQSEEMVRVILQKHKQVSYLKIDSSYGHDAFLLPSPSLNLAISNFLTCARRLF